jgi:uncharacterized membrane protein
MPHRNPLDARTLQLVGFCVTTSVAAQLMLRHGMASLGGVSGVALLARAAASPWVLGGLLVHLSGTLVWLLVLSRLDLSAAYPMGSLNYVLITLCSALLLHEQVPLMRWMGTSLILGGIVVVARGERRSAPAPAMPTLAPPGEEPR